MASLSSGGLTLRLRGPGSTVTVTLPTTATVQMLKAAAAERLSLPAVDLLTGYPPKPCDASPETLLSEVTPTPLRSGETVVVRAVSSAPLPPPTVAAALSAAAVMSTSAAPPSPKGSDTWTCSVCTLQNDAASRTCAACDTPNPGAASLTHPATAAASPRPSSGLWTCSVCTLQNEVSSRACAACGSPNPSPSPAAAAPADGGGSSSSRGGVGGTVSNAAVAKMPDDNSCLFHAISFLLSPSTSPSELRSRIAAQVTSQPHRWDEATLGKPQGEYVAFITNPIRWGGQVEIAIFSEIFRSEICIVDIQSGRMDCFGEGSGYAKRVYILYSGLHFDAVTLNPGAQRQVPTGAGSIAAADAAVQRLAVQKRSEGAFVDQNTMRLRCKICGFVAEGDYEARLHAGTMNHKEFAPA